MPWPPVPVPEGRQRAAAPALGWRVLAALLLTLAAPLQAATLRIASAFDPQTMDPHALALLYQARVSSQIYEGLVGRDRDFRLAPGLATSWKAISPTVWRFQLRPGVTFHDGSAFSADDVVFSLQRSLAPPSQRGFQLQGLREIRRVDALTVDLVTEAPDVILPEKLHGVGIMSRSWAQRHGVEKAQDFAGKQETHAVRHANGTGPFRLLRYEPDVRTTLTRHEAWWGWREADAGNLTEAVFLTLRSDATRLAALRSGEVDLLLDPAFQDIARIATDPRLQVLQAEGLSQQYLALDLHSPTLDSEGRALPNPLRDLRVRQAIRHAIAVPLIIDKVLRGQAVPAQGLLSPLIDGVPAASGSPWAHDPARARTLLAEAGLAGGFALALECVNTTWREAVCQSIAAMLNQVGIRATLRSTPTPQFFPRLTQGQIPFAEFGWVASPDPWSTLNALFRSPAEGGRGAFNVGRYRNPAADALIDRLRVEPDPERRRAQVAQALALIEADLPVIPLYRRTLAWALPRTVQAVIWPNDMIELRWVRR
jgi:peptide/nickel transport system substrate-binding protein